MFLVQGLSRRVYDFKVYKQIFCDLMLKGIIRHFFSFFFLFATFGVWRLIKWIESLTKNWDKLLQLDYWINSCSLASDKWTIGVIAATDREFVYWDPENRHNSEKNSKVSSLILDFWDIVQLPWALSASEQAFGLSADWVNVNWLSDLAVVNILGQKLTE